MLPQRRVEVITPPGGQHQNYAGKKCCEASQFDGLILGQNFTYTEAEHLIIRMQLILKYLKHGYSYILYHLRQG